jgi:phage tail-like protein
MARNDPYRQFRYRVVIVSFVQGCFIVCIFGDSTVAPVEYREGTDPTYQRKLSGLTKYGNITLKWGITDSMDLYTWYKDVLDKGAQDNRKKISIILIDEQGSEKSRWDIEECWPTKYDPPDFSAKGGEVAIETLELVAEHYKRVS